MLVLRLWLAGPARAPAPPVATAVDRATSDAGTRVDPPRRHGRVLRVRRAAPPARAARQAGRRRWDRPRGRRRGRVVRGASVRRPLGDAVGGRPAALPARRVPAGDHAPLRRGQRGRCTRSSSVTRRSSSRSPLDEAFLDVTGRERLLGDGPRSPRGSAPPSTTSSTSRARSAWRRTSSSPSWRRSRPSRSPTPERVSPGRGVVEVVARARAGVPPPAPGRTRCGVSARSRSHRLQATRHPHGRRPRRLDERTLARPSLGQHQAAHLTALAWGRDDRPVETDRDAKSIGHEETFSRDLFDARRPRSRAGAARRRRGVAAAAQRASARARSRSRSASPTSGRSRAR